MNEITCECGHVNPEGTVLCEACGKPIEGNQHINGNEDKKLLNMRYDGSARRSQTYNRTIVDKIWNFFSSVKVGVWLIVLTLIASAVGTILPQEMYIPPNVDPALHYRDQYGLLGQIYYQLGFHNLFSSWWYMLLLAMTGISIVIASIDRFFPLYKTLKKQKPRRHEMFMKKQRIFGVTESNQIDLELYKKNLKKRRFKISEQDGHILAEKNRFARWGPYVNHIGLIIFLIGSLLRFVPAFYIDDFIWVREGETSMIPGTEGEYYIKNKDFILETYDENDQTDARFKEAIQNQGGPIPKTFQTNAVIYERTDEIIPGKEPELTELKDTQAKMNHPIKFDDFALYQASYQLNEFKEMTFKIHDKGNEDTNYGEFTVDLADPKNEYTLDSGYRVEIDDYFPEYEMQDGAPVSVSKFPKNPAFVFTLYPPDSEEAETSFLGIGANVDASGENNYKIGLVNFDVRDVTGLTVKKDHTLPLIALGGAIFMIGVIQGMYWNHRRIWLQPKENGVWIAGHTNKNWYALRQEINKVIAGTHIQEPQDQYEMKE
ncbi:cytochrome c biogenesis protein ResB [Halobacillus halophilus]|uniref:Cytochrome c biogenesis protein ResB n=1 Tax=Halobacillus halophilus (strain ATCC 35676 / DSM 2266 / JCM 20832 / KCTC 3685 / LMG 17431 / NBRC 102448 / NCIMB 2269) TaxID=866895 RepID=I0JNF6_HALH3|nr:cytochrome c biogenesis protein ResB [Halobacillus halophilus]ASF39737.1 cytochrome c biogenesis protein ResB [Halobacillus halophilus]CCG45676.1 cytochrome c biogenesis protein ResB [Halobacillus halophilus DSM 2266]